MTAPLKLLGFDPSMTHWGIAAALYYPDTQLIDLKKVDVITPVKPTGKQVRQNSVDLAVAEQLASKVFDVVRDADAIFAEVPVGSQSARAMASYAMCVGVLGALRALGRPFHEVTAAEVKRLSTGDENATKSEMISWATKRYPNVNWPTHVRKGQTLITASEAEHMADACGAIFAGVQLPVFKQAMHFLTASAFSSSSLKH